MQLDNSLKKEIQITIDNLTVTKFSLSDNIKR